jgi:putative oxidoreductase
MTAPAPPNKAKTIALWILCGLIGLALTAGGMTKIIAMHPHPENFTRWGFPLWFMYLIGAVELAGGLLLLIPGGAAFGALLLICTMIGAVATHLVHADGVHVVPSLVILVLCTVILYARRDPLLTLAGRNRSAAGA